VPVTEHACIYNITTKITDTCPLTNLHTYTLLLYLLLFGMATYFRFIQSLKRLHVLPYFIKKKRNHLFELK